MIPAITFASVSKTFPSRGAGELVALHPTDFEIAPGRAIAIAGRSGSGKSTVLHLCAGIEIPTTGHVHLQGKALTSLTDRERTRVRRDHVGLVFQFFHLMSHLSVRENVALPLMIAGCRSRTTLARVDALLDRVALGHRARDSVEQLSGGEMQRVAICRALVLDPDIVLADEPTGNLDDATGRSVIELLFSLVRDRHGTLVYATHSTDLAARADEVWTLHSGHMEIP